MKFNPCCNEPDIQEQDRMSEPLFMCTSCGEPHCTPAEETEECNCDQALELKNAIEEIKKVLTATNEVMQLVIDGNKEALDKFK